MPISGIHMQATDGVLKVFVSAGCYGCDKALEMAAVAKEIRPGLKTEVIDLSEDPDAGVGLVFAVPTYVYNDRPVFLGNPSLQEFRAWLDQLGREA